VAVVHGADALDAATMQRFARWTNLSETTFLARPRHPDADYAVRIFTPATELQFAGHPTLGSAQAFLVADGAPRQGELLVQECGVGLVRIRRDGRRLAFAAPPSTEHPVAQPELTRVLAALGLAPADVARSALLDNGTPWLGLALHDAARLRALRPDHGALATLPKVGVIACTPGEETLYVVRAFAASAGIHEDPVTGSLNASLAQWLAHGPTPPPAEYVVAQGEALGRAGRVHVARHRDDVWIGGDVTPVITGSVEL
jgi:PhzF family phenazine biosynthesis protein